MPRPYSFIYTNKSKEVIFVAFKIFFNNIKYNDYYYIRFRINYKSKFDNYKIKIYRLSKNII